jgi:hypothetical protein
VSGNILDEWANAIQEWLRAGYKVASSTTSHRLLLGDAREIIVREVLMRFLPSSLVVGTGQIIDSKGNPSKQIDIIIYRSDFPIFRTLGLSDIFMLEGVVATIEVKSNLNKKTLKEALSNCESVKKLSPFYNKPSVERYWEKQQIQRSTSDKGSSDQQGPTEDELHSLVERVKPPAYVFGYTGYSSRLKYLMSAVEEWAGKGQRLISWLPDVISTEGCVVVRNDGRPFRLPGSEDIVYLSKRDNTPIKYLLKHLLHRLNTSIGMGTAKDKESGIMLGSEVHTMIDTVGNWQRWGKSALSIAP